jgi:hypothetical protein
MQLQNVSKNCALAYFQAGRVHSTVGFAGQEVGLQRWD